MVDTIRDRTTLLTLLADNTSRDISPQDLRDMLVSVHGVYGGLYVQDGSTAQTGVDTTPTKMTGWAGNLPAAGTTPDHTDDSITIGTDGIYIALCQVSFSGTISVTFEAHLRIDDVEQVEGFHRKLGTGGDVGSASFVALKSLSADEVLTVYIESDSGGGASFTPMDAQLVVFRVA